MSKTRPKKILISHFLVVLALEFCICNFHPVYAESPDQKFFFDKEKSQKNEISTTTVDAELTSPKDNFDPADKLYLGESSKREITIKNIGLYPFIYSIEVKGIADDQKVFCQNLNLKITKVNDESRVKIYDGSLEKLEINRNGDNSGLKLKPGESQDFELEITIPSDAKEILSKGVCSFDIRTVAWLEGLEYETAFWDEEELPNNAIATLDWLIKMGYETSETQKDETDGNPKLGFCNVTTTDKSQNGNTAALEILKWATIEHAESYRITGYKQKDDETWEEWGITYNPADYPERLSCNEDVCTYTSWASQEGTYAYFIEALSKEGKVIGRTIPEKDKFDCTFTVKWPKVGSVVINEIMWSGSWAIQEDFWVELRNTTDKEIDLTNWELNGAGESFHSVKLKGKIPANGYFLLTHYATNYETGNNFAAINDKIIADQVDGSVNLRHPKGEQLTLKAYTGDIIDQTPAASGDEEWAAGKEDNEHKLYQSMQRTKEPGDGTKQENWVTCSAEGCSSLDFWDEKSDEGGTKGIAYGTPKSENIY